MINLLLAVRPGPPPRLSGALLHQQLSQNAPESLQDELHERIMALPDVTLGRSVIWVEGSRSYWLEETARRGPVEASISGGEWGHMHSPTDGSLHVALPRTQAQQVETSGWGELHPLARGRDSAYAICMVFGPRNHGELETVLRVASSAYRHARGDVA